MQRGLIICLEGVDGAGKTTQAKLLEECGLFPKCQYIHFPTSEALPDIEKAEGDPDKLYLVYLTNFAGCQSMIKDLVDKGITVILDRYVLSDLVYTLCRKGDINRHLQLEKPMHGFIKPDVTFWLSLPEEIALTRMTDEDKNQFSLSFVKRLHSLYFFYFNYDVNVIRVNANISKDELHRSLRLYVERNFFSKNRILDERIKFY